MQPYAMRGRQGTQRAVVSTRDLGRTLEIKREARGHHCGVQSVRNPKGSGSPLRTPLPMVAEFSSSPPAGDGHAGDRNASRPTVPRSGTYPLNVKAALSKARRAVSGDGYGQ